MKMNHVEKYAAPWSGKVFQLKFQISGCTIISCAFFLALSALSMASMFSHNPSFSLMIRDRNRFNHSMSLGLGDVQSMALVANESVTNTLLPQDDDGEKESSQHVLDELFAPGSSDKETCLSRFESQLFRKPSPYKPSPYLLSKLRSYENLQKICGPYTKPYNDSLQQLNSGLPVNSSTACKYVVYTSMSGLGNRMLTVSSVFLYALLTNRVLLVQFENDSSNLFCEPFPDTTWLLPFDNPMRRQIAHTFDQKYPQSYGNMLKNKTLRSTIKSSPFLLMYLAYNIDKQDGFFYCDRNQAQIRSVPWLVITSNQYFVPYFFLMKSFKKELENLFPDKETVFHFLGRYLFQPSNEAWGLISRFYQAYLARADQRIGIQVRVFDAKTTPFQTVLDQILSCATNQKLLPKVDRQNLTANSLSDDNRKNHRSKAVLITSLYSEYYEHVKDMYWTKATETGEVVGIFQPSHEGFEQAGNSMHNMKAWAEIYLLSMSDVLVTSAMSTFGYVAQGLGGLKPWILSIPSNGNIPNPPCGQAVSIEPCFHFPPKYDCKGRTFDAGKAVPHVRMCEDASWGVKIVNSRVSE